MCVIFYGSMPLLPMKRSERTNSNNAIVNLFWNDDAYQQAIDIEKQWLTNAKAPL